MPTDQETTVIEMIGYYSQFIRERGKSCHRGATPGSTRVGQVAEGEEGTVDKRRYWGFLWKE